MKLPTVKVVEVHYWAIVLTDKFSPEGEEYPTRHATKTEAEAHAQRLVDKQLAAREDHDE
jgi:hypothetical protein